MKKRNLFVVILFCIALVFTLAAFGGGEKPDGQPSRRYWGTLVGTVTENDAGLSGVKVRSGDEETVTDENGNYSIKVYDNGATVVFEKQGCITQKKTFKSSSFYTDEIRYDFIMFISARVEGTVRNADGAAVSGATITIGVNSVETDADGKFVFESVIGTSMVLIAEHGGKTVRKPLYAEDMRTGNVTVEIIMEK